VFKLIRNYVEPKIKAEEARFKELKARYQAETDTLTRRDRTQAERQIEAQDALVTEIRSFKEQLEEITQLDYDPDLNDGVVLNIAPFHKLTPWQLAKDYWDELLEGKYEWSTMSQGLRAKGLVKNG
jgi:hypothetical protein